MSAQPPMAAAGAGKSSWDRFPNRLLDTDHKAALKAAIELKEHIESVPASNLPRFLANMIPAFSSVLSHCTRPSPDPTSVDHRLRNTILEILCRMPTSEILRPHAPTILALAVDVLIKDYEDNALLASRLTLDLHKNYRPMPQDQLQPYFDFVQGAYRSLPTSVHRNFLFSIAPLSRGNTPSPSPRDSKIQPNKVAVAKPEKGKSPMAIAAASSTQPYPPRLALKSGASFRVLTECPLTIMLLFQLYPKYVKTIIPGLISGMMEALALRAPPLHPKHKLDSNLKRLYFSRSRELVAAQVKTLSFLTYLLRGFGEHMKLHEDRIATNVIALMTTCPRESVSSRKELLVATRHILATEFRKGFFRHIDSLLDERILMGTYHRHSDQNVLNPLGYSTLADLVHHVRSILSMRQLSRVVYMFSRVLHDVSMDLPMTNQVTAVRLLLSIVEIIYQNKDPNPQVGRDLLDRILDALVNKLRSLKDCIGEVCLAESRNSTWPFNEAAKPPDPPESSSNSKGADDRATDATMEDVASPERDASNQEAKMVVSRSNYVESADHWMMHGGKEVRDTLRDLQSIVRSIIVGLKTVVLYISSYRQPKDKDRSRESSRDDDGPSRMTKLERDLLDVYIMNVFPCMQVYKVDANSLSKGKNQRSTHSQLYQTVLTYFAAAFTALDRYNLHHTIGKRVDVIVDAIVDDSAAMVVVWHLLGTSQRTSYEFCDVLLTFLVERLESLVPAKRSDVVVFVKRKRQGTDHTSDHDQLRKVAEDEICRPKKSSEEVEKNEKYASTLLELFEKVLKSISLYPSNEVILRRHIQDLVANCLRLSMERFDDWPGNYGVLLRCIFRCVSAGKFEESYKELLPMIPTILNGLHRISQATSNDSLRDVTIELCLTVPARLSSLLPHMSLLLRTIISALNSSKGDLVNLGLRTLEFWIDNLNPEFLFPVISKQSDVLTELMVALSDHLRPAPYPYGLLTLRLLGKLGGKNRRFLREPIDLASDNIKAAQIALRCQWIRDDPKEGEGHKRSCLIPLPIESAVHLLRMLAINQQSRSLSEARQGVDEFGKSSVRVSWTNPSELASTKHEQLDLSWYCEEVINDTTERQSQAALAVLTASVSCLVGVGDNACLEIGGHLPDSTNDATRAPQLVSLSQLPEQSLKRSESLKRLFEGFLFALSVDSVKDEARKWLHSLTHHTLAICEEYEDHIQRIDAHGTIVQSRGDDASSADVTKDVVGESTSSRQGSLTPFGYFHFAGPLRNKADPMVLADAVAEVLGQLPRHRQSEMLIYRDYLITQIRNRVASDVDDMAAVDPRQQKTGGAGGFAEKLLSALCRVSASRPWNFRAGVHASLCEMVTCLGRRWSMSFEIELVHVALLAVKTAPREISLAQVKAFQFFARMMSSLYGTPRGCHDTGREFLKDLLLADERQNDSSAGGNEESGRAGKQMTSCPSDRVIHILLTELASTKHLVRCAVRYALSYHVFNRSGDSGAILKKHLSTIKRVLFARSLRLLTLSEQVGVVEALAVVVNSAPTVLALDDQHVLAFLSEFLKLSSIADGEMADSNMVGHVVNKDGFVNPAYAGLSGPSRPSSSMQHMNGIFLRRESVVHVQGEKYVVIPEELPCGVQLRVSALRLFNTVIRRHSDSFFDADQKTPIGNIRPHVISLLFRSLVATPSLSVLAAHEALRDVLSLSVVTKDGADGSKSQSRLPKELLQTCIRPVLLNLRDYTKLSMPLLRGLARLLSLLSSWFNKTLGEKLLEHLQKWTEPDRIIARKIWRSGDEPIVAAYIMDLFALLPHASQFVEPLVKTAIKLESALPRFKSHFVCSPYRRPLARYLNKHSQYAVGFFFQRLKSPVYSDLFQEIVMLEQSGPLRQYLSGRQCSVNLLNACFERPLAIIRSQKTAASSSGSSASRGNTTTPTKPTEILAMHGIITEPVPSSKQKEAILRQDIDLRQKKVVVLQQEVARTKEAMQAASSAGSSAIQEFEEAKKRHEIALSSLEKGQRALSESKQRYASERAHPRPAQPEPVAKATRTMTGEALELQHQGFKLVESLVAHDESYLNDHNDVVRAFRWLWRSKGRHLRLQHEELVPPRFHQESRLLSSLLVRYSSGFPKDVDVLFELLRIFLQPTTANYLFVKEFLANTVTNVLTEERKRHVIERFFALLAGEGPEETKVLSIQLIVFPLLLSTFSRQQKANDSTKLHPDPDAEQHSKAMDTSKEVFGSDSVRKFVKGVLFKEGKLAIYGDRLRVELLRLSTLLIEYKADGLAQHRKDVFRFSWSLLKTDDLTCKNWAYLNVCRFIAAFGSPPKIILQVYGALVRLYHHDGRALVRSSVGFLLPAIQQRFGPAEMQKIAENTGRILSEDSGNTLQAAHLWYAITTHPSVYVKFRFELVGQIMTSLSRFGLQPNCPLEHRSLALAAVETVLGWSDIDLKSGTLDVTKKRQADTAPQGRPTKKAKAEQGTAIPSEDGATKMKPGEGADLKSDNSKEFVLDNKMVRLLCAEGPTLLVSNDVRIKAETIANFLVKMRVSLAEPKSDRECSHLERKASQLLACVLRKWPSCLISPRTFEKAVFGEQDSALKAGESQDLRNKERAKKTFLNGGGKPGKAASLAPGTIPSRGRDDTILASDSVLVGCLDVFVTLTKCSPDNQFLREQHQIVGVVLQSAFHRARKRAGVEVRRLLKDFVVMLYRSHSHDVLSSAMSLRIRVLIESLMVDTKDDEVQRPRGSESAGYREKPREDDSTESPFPSDDGKTGGSSVAYFSLCILEEILQAYPSASRLFTGALVSLASRLVADHLHDLTSSNQRSSGTSAEPRTAGTTQLFPTSTCGILEEANMGVGNTGKSKSHVKKPQQQDTEEIGTALRALCCCLRLLGSSLKSEGFSSDRNTFFQILLAVMRHSDNVQVLLTAISTVGEWLLDDRQSSEMTKEERKVFLEVLSMMDARGLPSAVSQPIADLVGHIALLLNEKVQSVQESALRRMLGSSLMTANRSLRSKVHDVLRTRLTPGNNLNEARCILDNMKQFCSMDFFGVGGRLWPIVFVEVLLQQICIMKDQSSDDTRWLPTIQSSQDAANAVASNPTLLSLTKANQSSSRWSSELLDGVCTLAYGDPSLCQELFEVLFCASWSALDGDDCRFSLLEPVERLLAQPYHAQFFRRPTTGPARVVSNAIQSFFRVLCKLDPLPMLKIDLVVSLSSFYNITHEVLWFLETQREILLAASSTSATYTKITKCLCDCLLAMGEENLALSGFVHLCEWPATKWAVSVDLHGMTREAIGAYSSLINLYETGDMSTTTPPSFDELGMWEARWVELQKEMCELNLVKEFATVTKDHHLLLETAWKTEDWETVKSLGSSPALISMTEEGNPALKISEIFLAINDGKLSEVENLHAQTAQLCLYKWQLLPSLAQGSPSHASLLQTFHRLVELRESGQIMVETLSHSNRRTFPDLKNLLSAWRHRLPNEYDTLTKWDDILGWRSHMFSAISSNFQWSEPGTLATLHDRPWTAIRMAKAARKQNLREVALLSLSKTDGAMDVSDAFSKLREQILACNNPDSEVERTGGLNLVNTTNLSFFDPSQKSELFRLKAQFLSSLGGRSKANQAYCHAVQICPSYARAWVSWGSLCSSLGRLAEKQGEQQASKTSNPESAKEATVASAKKVAQYLAQAMGCYLEAIQCDTHEWSRIHLSKCLWMLAKDGSSPGVLCQTLETRATALPPWVWLPWTPQLLTSLYRTEGRAVKAILTNLAKIYPQALYFPLRAFYLERRDVERSKGGSSSGSQGSVSHSEELMSSLRRAHANLWSSLEAILEELIVKFRPSFEEELLATMGALLERAESQNDSLARPSKDKHQDDTEAVVASVSKTLGRISTKLFRESSPEALAIKRDERARKTEVFKRRYKKQFESDFLSAQTGPEKLSLSQYLTRLKKWKRMLEEQVSMTPLTLPLIESSQSLALFASESPDLWPMSCDPKAAGLASADKERLRDAEISHSSTSSSALAAKSAAASAAISVAVSCASEGNGGEYGGGSASIEIPGQYVPNSDTFQDSKPCPEVHAKLIRFSSQVSVIRRNEQLVRRVGMVGSDGKTHLFLLQFAIPYWTRTDERTTQIHYLVDKVLRRDIMSSRCHLSTKPTAIIPIAQRLRMTSERTMRVSLDDVLRQYCDRHRYAVDNLANQFHRQVSDMLDAEEYRNTDARKRAALEASCRLKVYKSMATQQLEARMVLNHLTNKLPDAEGLFNFRKAFAGHFAVNSLLQFVFSVVPRNPSRMVFNETNGHVLSPEFRFSYNNQGFLDIQKVPFRLTPNLVELMGALVLDGRFVPGMATVATAMKTSMDDIDAPLRLLLRDDLVAWYTSKSMSKSDAKTQELEKQLADRVTKNVAQIQSKIGDCSLRVAKNSEAADLPTKPVDARVRDLMREASSHDRLCLMPGSYHPWM